MRHTLIPIIKIGGKWPFLIPYFNSIYLVNMTYVTSFSWKAGRLPWWASKGELGGVPTVDANPPPTPAPTPEAAPMPTPEAAPPTMAPDAALADTTPLPLIDVSG